MAEEIDDNDFYRKNFSAGRGHGRPISHNCGLRNLQIKEDILMEVRRCHLLRCFYCQRLGANIGCCRKRCRRTFHTKCGYDNLTVSQFSGRYNSNYCHKHIPKYRIRLGTAGHCVICFESVVAKGHQGSVAVLSERLVPSPVPSEVRQFGGLLLQVPAVQRKGELELEPNAFADLMQRAEYCILPDCRIRPSATSAADLLYCILCGSNPMHTHCTFETASTYRCDDCIVIKPSVASGSDESDSEVDVFDRLAELLQRQRIRSPA
ncbi:PHD finger protein 7-like [Drosophila kikkawai]|uniref:PHD finger protein 7-like n=1 Tax=Drosophila kikkawai TaxID=30033 RepID=A0ABM3C7X4_DROKI